LIGPDAKIFTSLPRSGTVRAARLLAEIGDARGRFPTPEALTCLAGAAPSTRQSGKHKIVAFRWAVDKQLRGAVIDFAGDSWRCWQDRVPYDPTKHRALQTVLNRAA
jgi:transposase